MRGGCYDHIYLKELRDLIDSEMTLHTIAIRLEEVNAPDAASDIKKFIRDAKIFYANSEVFLKRISALLRAVEYIDSGDILPGELEKAIEQYRAGFKNHNTIYVIQRRPATAAWNEICEIVYGMTSQQEFGTWIFNKESQGFSSEHYFAADADAAWQDFLKRT